MVFFYKTTKKSHNTVFKLSFCSNEVNNKNQDKIREQPINQQCNFIYLRLIIRKKVTCNLPYYNKVVSTMYDVGKVHQNNEFLMLYMIFFNVGNLPDSDASFKDHVPPFDYSAEYSKE